MSVSSVSPIITLVEDIARVLDLGIRAATTVNGPVSTLFGTLFSNKHTPALDIHENSGSYTMKFSVPGASKDNYNIDYDKETNDLVISGEVFPEDQDFVDKNGKLIHKEIVVGKFHRKVHLPDEVEGEKIKAKFRDGMLILKVPKVKSGFFHKIQID